LADDGPLANKTLARPDSGTRTDFMRNERTAYSLYSGSSSEETEGKP